MATISAAYLIATRAVGEVYDPIWLIGAGVREGSPGAIYFGVALCAITIPSMFAWLAYRHVMAYLLALMSCLLWGFICVCLEQVLFA